jgi:hypothetical protein
VLQSTSESPLAAITHLKKICGHVLICMKPGYDNINNDFTDVRAATSTLSTLRVNPSTT